MNRYHEQASPSKPAASPTRYTASLIQVLGELRTFLGGEKATLLWDGLPAHRSTAMRAWLNTQRH